MTENEPAHTTTTTSSEMCARAFTTPVNARGVCIVRWSTTCATAILPRVLDSLVAFVAVSAVVICTPGQDTALTIRNTLAGGRPSGVATAGRRRARPGCLDGRGERRSRRAADRLRAACSGRSSSSEPRTSSTSARSRSGRPSRGAAHEHAVRSERAALARRAPCGRASSRNLGNPKMAVFFASLLPQFAPDGERVVRGPRSRSASSSAR